MLYLNGGMRGEYGTLDNNFLTARGAKRLMRGGYDEDMGVPADKRRSGLAGVRCHFIASQQAYGLPLQPLTQEFSPFT